MMTHGNSCHRMKKMITTRTFTDMLLLVWLLTILRNECVTAAAADTTSCTNVFLAPSSVSNAGGWGVFAAQDYQVGDVIVSVLALCGGAYRT
jgi:hypothetical protein